MPNQTEFHEHERDQLAERNEMVTNLSMSIIAAVINGHHGAPLSPERIIGITIGVTTTVSIANIEIEDGKVRMSHGGILGRSCPESEVAT